MNRKLYNIEDLRSYLLGAASADDAERMDEMSIADNEFADMLGAAEKDLIDSYINGEQDADLLQRFEEYYLTTPLRREKVRFAEVFREFSDEKIKEFRSRKKKPESATGQKKTSFLSLLTGFGRLLSVPTIATAAVLAAMALLGWLAVRGPSEKGIEVVTNINNNAAVGTTFPSPGPQPRATPAGSTLPTGPKQSPSPEAPSSSPEPKEPTQPVIASFVLTPPLRGTAVPTVRVSSAATRANVRLELESDEFAFYDVELKNAGSGAVVWLVRKVRPVKSSGVISVDLKVPAKILSPAVYTIRVSGLSAKGTTETVGDYPFRVVQ